MLRVATIRRTVTEVKTGRARCFPVTRIGESSSGVRATNSPRTIKAPPISAHLMAKRQPEAYVLVLLHNTERSTIDPLSERQW